MTERRPGLSRGEFNKIFTIGFIAAFSLPLQEKFEATNKYFVDPETEFLNTADRVERLPDGFAGVHYNAPFLWKRSGNAIDDFVGFARDSTTCSAHDKEAVIKGIDDVVTIPAYIVRVQPESPGFFLENKLGEVEMRQLIILKDFIDYLPEDFRVILPIIDGYWLFRSNIGNPMYGKGALDSVYLEDTSTRRKTRYSQIKFFEGMDERAAYKNRADAFIDIFGDNPKVILEMGNEVAAPLSGQKGKDINTAWYSEMYSHFRNRYRNPLLTGIADPNHIDYSKFADTENLITTSHAYFPRLKQYPAEVPVIVEEIGVAKEMLGMELKAADPLLKQFIAGTINNGITNGLAKVGSVFLWHADKGHDTDNLAIDEEKYSETVDYIRRLSPKLQQMYA